MFKSRLNSEFNSQSLSFFSLRACVFDFQHFYCFAKVETGSTVGFDSHDHLKYSDAVQVTIE